MSAMLNIHYDPLICLIILQGDTADCEQLPLILIHCTKINLSLSPIFFCPTLSAFYECCTYSNALQTRLCCAGMACFDDLGVEF